MRGGLQMVNKRAREEFGYKVKIAKLKFDRFAR